MKVARGIARTSSGRIVLAHSIHLAILLWPTLVLVVLGSRAEFDWAMLLFALGILAVGVLESTLLVTDFDERNFGVKDPLAIGVAQFVGIALLGVFWLAQFERIGGGGLPIAAQCVGGVILAVGIALRSLAVRTLGARFVSDIRIAEALVHDGIYRWMRHPSEVAIVLFAIGGPVLLGAPMTAIGALALLLPISLWRMRREDIAIRTIDQSVIEFKRGKPEIHARSAIE